MQVSYLCADLPFKNFIYSAFGLVIVKNKLTSVFYASVVLLKIDNVMTKFDRRIKNFPIWEAIQEVLSKTFFMSGKKT